MALIIFFSIIVRPSNHLCLLVVAASVPAATRDRPCKTCRACLVVVAVCFLYHRRLSPAATCIDCPLLQQVGNIGGCRQQCGTSPATHAVDRPSLH
ncbi:hypothetical protein ACLOJK_036836 [Asimina triloba]